jgi:hypothetical protein
MTQKVNSGITILHCIFFFVLPNKQQKPPKVEKHTSVLKNSSTTVLLFLDNTECRWALDLFKIRATNDNVSAAAHLS